MSDMELAELNAFKSVWPSCLCYVCSMHSARAVNRNICDAKKEVPVLDRPSLQKDFKVPSICHPLQSSLQSCVYAENVPMFLDRWVNLLENAQAASPSIYAYFKQQFEIISFANYRVHGSKFEDV